MKKLLYLFTIGTMLIFASCTTPTIETQVRDISQYTADIDFTYSGVSEDVVWLDAVAIDTYGHRREFQFDITPGEGQGTMHFDGLHPGSKVYIGISLRYNGKPLSDKTLAVIELDTKEYKAEPVDLGLSVKWYSENLGANGNPFNAGNYYAWGEVKPQEKGWYKFNSYTFWPFYKRTPDDPLPRYDLEPRYDAATVAMGKGWRIPTHEECVELITMCECKMHRILGGGAYMHVTGPSGKSIVLPCGEYKADAYLKRDNNIRRGFYWASTLAAIKQGDRYPYYTYKEAYSFWFTDEKSRRRTDCCSSTTTPRTHGLNIRPVCDK